MEVLSRMISKAVQGGFLSGVEVGRANGLGLMVSHILYADDTLLFCNAEALQVGYLRCVLLCFEAVSGLKVNLGKSEMIPIRAVDDIGALAQILGCRVVLLPTVYLGLPLGSSFKSKSPWDSVVERFQRRLASWKHQFIPKGGRLTLMKKHTCFMFLFVIPVSMAKRLEKIQRDFLWGGIQRPSR